MLSFTMVLQFFVTPSLVYAQTRPTSADVKNLWQQVKSYADSSVELKTLAAKEEVSPMKYLAFAFAGIALTTPEQFAKFLREAGLENVNSFDNIIIIAKAAREKLTLERKYLHYTIDAQLSQNILGIETKYGNILDALKSIRFLEYSYNNPSPLTIYNPEDRVTQGDIDHARDYYKKCLQEQGLTEETFLEKASIENLKANAEVLKVNTRGRITKLENLLKFSQKYETFWEVSTYHSNYTYSLQLSYKENLIRSEDNLSSFRKYYNKSIRAAQTVAERGSLDIRLEEMKLSTNLSKVKYYTGIDIYNKRFKVPSEAFKKGKFFLKSNGTMIGLGVLIIGAGVIMERAANSKMVKENLKNYQSISVLTSDNQDNLPALLATLEDNNKAQEVVFNLISENYYQEFSEQVQNLISPEVKNAIAYYYSNAGSQTVPQKIEEQMQKQFPFDKNVNTSSMWQRPEEFGVIL